MSTVAREQILQLLSESADSAQESPIRRLQMAITAMVGEVLQTQLEKALRSEFSASAK
ncbi:Uncharacterised protein [Mycobacterium tuberculosis]|nr:Uncharacterised protein [Mycobacterium tuberculosis]